MKPYPYMPGVPAAGHISGKRWTTADGGRIDVIDLTLTSSDAGDRRVTEATGDGQWYRVTGPCGNYRGKYRTPAELTTLGIDLAGMKEAA